MFKIKIFGKKDCEACQGTKEKFKVFLENFDRDKKNLILLEFFDIDTVDGLLEGTMLDAVNPPTTIIEHDGKEIKRWTGKIPLSKEIQETFKF